jgi:hypothetical protein
MAAETTPTDVALDGLAGAVRSVRVETADRSASLRARRWGPRTLVETLAYDALGNRLEWAFYDDTGALSRRYAYEYDAGGRRVRSVVSGPGDALVETAAYVYDDDRRLVTDTITDARRHGVPYAHRTREHDGASVTTRARDDGTPGRREEIVYTRAGRAAEMLVYAPSGALDHRWVYGYDREGRRTSEISYHADGSFRSKEICKYNDRGDEYKVAVFRPDGSLSTKWAYTYAYDAAGNWTRRTIHLKTRGIGTARYAVVAALFRSIAYY